MYHPLYNIEVKRNPVTLRVNIRNFSVLHMLQTRHWWQRWDDACNTINDCTLSIFEDLKTLFVIFRFDFDHVKESCFITPCLFQVNSPLVIVKGKLPKLSQIT